MVSHPATARTVISASISPISGPGLTPSFVTMVSTLGRAHTSSVVCSGKPGGTIATGATTGSPSPTLGYPASLPTVSTAPLAVVDSTVCVGKHKSKVSSSASHAAPLHGSIGLTSFSRPTKDVHAVSS